MRFYHFFMKFTRSFLLGFSCGIAAVLVIAVGVFACYCVFFI